MTQFTPQDADTLIAHAQTAPLRNMLHAEQTSMLLRRFKEWFEAVHAEEQKALSKPRKARQETPASTPGDPAS